MSDELDRRPNDTIIWARGFLPAVEGFTDWVFKVLEWMILIGFIHFLSEKFDSEILGWIHRGLVGLVMYYALVIGWAKAPLVPFGQNVGKWRTRGIYAASMIISLAVNGTLVALSSYIAGIAAKASAL